MYKIISKYSPDISGLHVYENKSAILVLKWMNINDCAMHLYYTYIDNVLVNEIKFIQAAQDEYNNNHQKFSNKYEKRKRSKQSTRV